jgi:CelD/BcsL family acetyltransferase involved in cellulose biosynthesis
MQTRFITTDEELIALKETWDSLAASRPETDMPFYSWDWFYRSWIHFGKPAGQELYIVAVYESDKPVGILPLVRGSRKSSGIAYRILCFCNVGMMPRNTMYIDSDYDQESVFRAAWEHLFANRLHWDMLELATVPDTSPFHRFVLEGEHAKGYALIQNKGFIAPYIEVTGSLEDYLKSLSKGTRKDINKHVRHFEESGSTRSVRFYEKPAEIAEGLKHLETVHSNSWKGGYDNPHYPLFYQEVTPILAERGEVKVVIALLDDVPIGAGYMLCKGDTYYGCIRDYDQKYREHAPGILLLHFQLEHLLQEGGRIFDFCGTTYDHKEKFGTGHHNHSTFQICHSGLKSRLVYSAKTFLLPLIRKIMRKPADGDFVFKRKTF